VMQIARLEKVWRQTRPEIEEADRRRRPEQHPDRKCGLRRDSRGAAGRRRYPHDGPNGRIWRLESTERRLESIEHQIKSIAEQLGKPTSRVH